MSATNEKVLGHFLKYKRLSADPSVFGITRGPHRRVTGLRREEVAERAHVSTDWYARIEQGRLGANPSPEVLAALCRVLQLSPAETRYVFNLVGQRPLERPVSGVSAALRDPHAGPAAAAGVSHGSPVDDRGVESGLHSNIR